MPCCTSCSMATICTGGGGGYGDGGGSYGRPRPGLLGPAGATGATGEVDLPASGESATDATGDPSNPIFRGNNWQGTQTGQTMPQGQQDILSSANVAQNLQLHPNPTSDKVFIEFNSIRAGSYTITVTDIKGQELYTHELNASIGNNNHVIDVKNFAAGTYIVNVKNSYGLQQIKFEKQ